MYFDVKIESLLYFVCVELLQTYLQHYLICIVQLIYVFVCD